MLAVWQCRHPPPSPAPCALWICPCPSWPALEAGNQCRLVLGSAWVWALWSQLPGVPFKGLSKLPCHSSGDASELKQPLGELLSPPPFLRGGP